MEVSVTSAAREVGMSLLQRFQINLSIVQDHSKLERCDMRDRRTGAALTRLKSVEGIPPNSPALTRLKSIEGIPPYMLQPEEQNLMGDVIEESVIAPVFARTHGASNPKTAVQSTATEQEKSFPPVQSQSCLLFAHLTLYILILDVMLFCHVVLSQLSVLLKWRSSGGKRKIWRSQRGHYICEVIHECKTINKYVFLHISSEDFSLVVPPAPVFANPGSDIILPAHLSPETSAVSMEIKWSRGAELIYQYNNGQENTNTEYESRVSLSIRELENGKLALTLRNVQQTDSGDYTCKVFHDGCQQTGLIHLQVRAEDFSLVVPPAPVFANPGSDIILPAHLSPETSAVSMEIRWSRGAKLIYQYNNGQENTNTEYESRVSLSIRELENGKLALTLRNVQQTDSGDYTCKVFHDGCQQTGLIHLQVRGFVPKRRSSMDEDRPLIVVEPEGSDKVVTHRTIL
ncbi:butyrophilin subfamily 1 member A1-like protein [Labeo rohita]|uniref:Butyrophilin subfamily 1 member A1-like protein n=1 Tax=Labeo rohita TaxID=84645 RepID=A0A498LH27_LABRO|nr:butyrophilin subfamily 1 member A1-like protein [Labeo rohita]